MEAPDAATAPARQEGSLGWFLDLVADALADAGMPDGHDDVAAMARSLLLRQATYVLRDADMACTPDRAAALLAGRGVLPSAPKPKDVP